LDADSGIAYSPNGNEFVFNWNGASAAKVGLDGKDLTVYDDLFVIDAVYGDSARFGTTETDPGTGNIFIEGSITCEGVITSSTGRIWYDYTALTNQLKIDGVSGL